MILAIGTVIDDHGNQSAPPITIPITRATMRDKSGLLLTRYVSRESLHLYLALSNDEGIGAQRGHFPGTYAALGCGMIGNYNENNQANTGHDWLETKAAAKVVRQRCTSACHKQPSRLLPYSLADERGVSFWQPSLDDPRLLTSRHIVFNLSRPEKSLVLLAPLAEESGGWGLCRTASTKRSAVFLTKADPGYKALLALVTAGRDYLDQNKRFDMSDFIPRVDWVREMKRYGVLSSRTKPEDITSAYEVEQDYWESLWHQPVQTSSPVRAAH